MKLEVGFWYRYCDFISLLCFTFHLVTSAAVHWTLNRGNRIGVYFKVFLSWSIPQGNFCNNPERISTFFFVCPQSHFPCCRDTCLHISDTVLLMIISKRAPLKSHVSELKVSKQAFFPFQEELGKAWSVWGVVENMCSFFLTGTHKFYTKCKNKAWWVAK